MYGGSDLKDAPAKTVASRDAIQDLSNEKKQKTLSVRKSTERRGYETDKTRRSLRDRA